MIKLHLIHVSDVLVLLALVLVASGCDSDGAPGPRTHEVTGQVIYANGSALMGGAITFTLASDPSIAASGDIAADGAFTLYTIVGSQRFVGAVEGEHRVTIIPAMGADQKFVSVRLKTNMIKVEAKENHFKIEIEKDPNS